MSKIDDILTLSNSREQFVFEISGLMKTLIEDLDGVKYRLDEDETTPLTEEIDGLVQRSLGAVARLFDSFRTPLGEDKWYEEMSCIIFPFLKDHFEARVRLLAQIWDRMKVQNFATVSPELQRMGATIAILTELLQEFSNEIDSGRLEAITDDIAAKLGLVA